MARCWTCRPRRLKCDGGQPHCQKCRDRGVECLGYQKPLTWVSGVHVRGPMKNRGFGDNSEPSHAPSAATSPCSTASMSSVSLSFEDPSQCPSNASSPASHTSSGTRSNASARARNSQLVLWTASNQSSVPITLTEPVLQDFDYTSRFLIDYFSQRVCPIIVLKDGPRNPYRDLISLAGSSPAISSAMMALSSCHLAHSLVGSPILALMKGRPVKHHLDPGQDAEKQVDVTRAIRLTDMNTLHLSRRDVVQHYIKYKQISLRLLGEALSNPETSTAPSTLATVVLMMLGDLWESGAGSWDIHLEGARGLLEAGSQAAVKSGTQGQWSLIDDVTLCETIGLSFARPSLLTRPLSPEQRTVDWSNVGCPTKFLNHIKFFAYQRRAKHHSASDLAALDEALVEVRTFDASAWARSVINDNAALWHMPVDDLQQLAFIFQRAVDIYGSRIVSTIRHDPNMPQPPLEPLIAAYDYFGREDDYLVKCLIWPTFIAGATSTNNSQRKWALLTFDRLWQITLSANCKNAALVLTDLWEKHDRDAVQFKATAAMDGDANSTSDEAQRRDFDWISELASLEDSWLFV